MRGWPGGSFSPNPGGRTEPCQASLLLVSEKSCRSHRRSPPRTAPAGEQRGPGPARGQAGLGPALPALPGPPEKAEGLAAKPRRLISQPASLPPENSNQNKIIITPMLFFFPRGRAWAPAGAPCRGASPGGRAGCLPGPQMPGSAEPSGARSLRDGPSKHTELNRQQRRRGENGTLTRRSAPPPPTAAAGRAAHPRSAASPAQPPAGLPAQPVPTGAAAGGARFPTCGRGETFSGLGLTGPELLLAARPPHTTPAASLGFRAAQALPPLPKQEGSFPAPVPCWDPCKPSPPPTPRT